MKIDLFPNTVLLIFRFIAVNFIAVIFFQYSGLIYLFAVNITVLLFVLLKFRLRTIEITDNTVTTCQKNYLGASQKVTYDNNDIIFIYRKTTVWTKYHQRSIFSNNSLLGDVLTVCDKNGALFELRPDENGVTDGKILNTASYLKQIGIKQQFEKFGENDVILD